MKWPNSPNANQGKPFLVLPPLLETGCRSVSAEPAGVVSPMVTMPPVTGTWPLKKKKCNNNKKKSIRPKTATLERPILLDIGMLNKVDMSLVKKEFLCVANLCRLTVRSVTPLKAKRPRSLQKELEKSQEITKSDINNKNNLWTRKVTKIKKINDVIKKSCKSKSVKMISPDCDKDKKNTKTDENKTPRSKDDKNNGSGDMNEKNTRKVIVLVQPPCTTCGRNEQPERFHSHPNPKTPIKTDKTKPRRRQEKEPTTPVKKSLTCYICAREFGSTSLQLHEPQCLKKWERENNLLPKPMRRKPPIKPDPVGNTDKWNQLAWEASQASLCPCENCGRTFLPDRLAVHQRSCRPPFGGSRSQVSKISSPPPTSPGPPAVRCYICGRLFGTKSIGIHEPQCLRKWKYSNELLPPAERKPLPVKPLETLEAIAQSPPAPEPSTSAEPENNEKPTLECYVCKQLFSSAVIYEHEPICLKKFRAQNEKLPPEKRLPEPQRGDIKFTQSGGVDFVGTFNRIWENHLAELVPCRKCGRRFFPDRIEKHEKACNNLPIKRKKK